MPRGRNADDRLTDLGRRLDSLEAQKSQVARREYTNAEIVEIALTQLAYVYEGDVEAFAEHLIQDHGLPFEEAEEIAGDLGRTLEDRRASAPNPQYPV